jgi:glucose-1-phosphate adenylyltransferase
MGNYVFNTEVLLKALRETKEAGETDFGQHVLPRLLRTHRLFAYDFATNEIPRIQPYEDRYYWRDLGTIDAYFAAHKDVLGLEPVFDMFNPEWPIYSSNYQGPVARIQGGEINNSLLGAATVVHKGARVTDSIIRRETVIEEDVVLENCIVMDYVRVSRGTHLRNVIVDRHNFIEPGEVIGYDAEQDVKRFTVTAGGVTVIPAGRVGYFARDVEGSRRGGYGE